MPTTKNKHTNTHHAADGDGLLDRKAIGRRIAQARREKDGMTQRELAPLMGVTERSVANWEAGVNTPYRFMKKLGEVLEKPSTWLLYGDTPPLSEMDAIHAKLDRILYLLEK